MHCFRASNARDPLFYGMLTLASKHRIWNKSCDGMHFHRNIHGQYRIWQFHRFNHGLFSLQVSKHQLYPITPHISTCAYTGYKHGGVLISGISSKHMCNKNSMGKIHLGIMGVHWSRQIFHETCAYIRYKHMCLYAGE